MSQFTWTVQHRKEFQVCLRGWSCSYKTITSVCVLGNWRADVVYVYGRGSVAYRSKIVDFPILDSKNIQNKYMDCQIYLECLPRIQNETVPWLMQLNWVYVVKCVRTSPSCFTLNQFTTTPPKLRAGEFGCSRKYTHLNISVFMMGKSMKINADSKWLYWLIFQITWGACCVWPLVMVLYPLFCPQQYLFQVSLKIFRSVAG